jgi:hypothetical protein
MSGDHWRAAIESGSPTGSHIKGDFGPISTNHQNEKTPENIGKDAFRGFAMSPLVTPTGIEQSSKSRGKTIDSDSVPPLVPPLESITDDLRELVDCWRSMSPDERSALMAVARGMVANKNPIPKTVHNKHKTRSGHLAP